MAKKRTYLIVVILLIISSATFLYLGASNKIKQGVLRPSLTINYPDEENMTDSDLRCERFLTKDETGMISRQGEKIAHADHISILGVDSNILYLLLDNERILPMDLSTETVLPESKIDLNSTYNDINFLAANHPIISSERIYFRYTSWDEDNKGTEKIRIFSSDGKSIKDVSLQEYFPNNTVRENGILPGIKKGAFVLFDRDGIAYMDQNGTKTYIDINLPLSDFDFATGWDGNFYGFNTATYELINFGGSLEKIGNETFWKKSKINTSDHKDSIQAFHFIGVDVNGVKYFSYNANNENWIVKTKGEDYFEYQFPRDISREYQFWNAQITPDDAIIFPGHNLDNPEDASTAIYKCIE